VCPALVKRAWSGIKQEEGRSSFLKKRSKNFCSCLRQWGERAIVAVYGAVFRGVVMAGAAASVALLVLIAAAHVYWALGGRAGKSAAIPERNGLPVIQPGALATLAVAIALLAAAGVVATQAGLIFAGAFQPYALILSVLLAFAFLARGVGDFRYVGFFKRVVGSRFARLDTWVFSPLCVLLGLLIADAIVGAF
jgi:hypothetical protein